MQLNQFLLANVARDDLVVQSISDFMNARADEVMQFTSDVQQVLATNNSTEQNNIIAQYANSVTPIQYPTDDGSSKTVTFPTDLIIHALVDGRETITSTDGLTMYVEDIYSQIADSQSVLRTTALACSTLATDGLNSLSDKLSHFMTQAQMNFGTFSESVLDVGKKIVAAFSDAAASPVDTARYLINLCGFDSISQSEAMPSLMPDQEIIDASGVSVWSCIGAYAQRGFEGFKEFAKHCWDGLKAIGKSVVGPLWTRIKQAGQIVVGTKNAFKTLDAGDSVFSDYGIRSRDKNNTLGTTPAGLTVRELPDKLFNSYAKFNLPFADCYMFKEKDDTTGAITWSLLTYLRPVKGDGFFISTYNWGNIQYYNTAGNLVKFDQKGYYPPGSATSRPYINVRDFIEHTKLAIQQENSWTFETDAEINTGLQLSLAWNLTFLAMLGKFLGVEVSDNDPYAALGNYVIYSDEIVEGMLGASAGLFGQDWRVDNPVPVVQPGSDVTNLDLTKLLSYNGVSAGNIETMVSYTAYYTQEIRWAIIDGLFADDYSAFGYLPYVWVNFRTPGRYAVIQSEELFNLGVTAVLTAALAVGVTTAKIASIKLRKKARQLAWRQAATERDLTKDLLNPEKAGAAFKSINKLRMQSTITSKLSSVFGISVSSVMFDKLSSVVGGLTNKVSSMFRSSADGQDIESASGPMPTTKNVIDGQSTTDEKIEQVYRSIVGNPT